MLFFRSIDNCIRKTVMFKKFLNISSYFCTHLFRENSSQGLFQCLCDQRKRCVLSADVNKVTGERGALALPLGQACSQRSQRQSARPRLVPPCLRELVQERSHWGTAVTSELREVGAALLSLTATLPWAAPPGACRLTCAETMSGQQDVPVMHYEGTVCLNSTDF